MIRAVVDGRAAPAAVALACGLNFIVGMTGATAGPLDPLAYSSQGAFVGTASPYTIIEDPFGAFPNVTLTSPAGTIATAVVSNGVAVFDFDSIVLPSTSTLNGFVELGAPSIPVAFLSRGDVTIAGTVNLSGLTEGDHDQNNTAPGGSYGGYYTSNGSLTPAYGPGAGGNGPYFGPFTFGSAGAGGGGFGGNGGAGGYTVGTGTGGAGGGLPGGSSNGNLATLLQGGAGGGYGAGAPVGPFSGGNGGSGGGGVEFGALGQIVVSGSINVNGGAGAENNAYGPAGGGGGGSGGGIFLHAATVTLSGSLSANGGLGGTSGTGSGGGGGGGGQILIETNPGGFNLLGGSFSATGGGGGGGDFGAGAATGLAGSDGTVVISAAVPEPSAFVSLGIGLCGLLGVLRYARPAARLDATP